MTKIIQRHRYCLWILIDWKIFGFGFNYTPYAGYARDPVKFKIGVYLPFIHMEYQRLMKRPNNTN